MAQPIEQWITEIPPVTRAWVAGSIGMSLLVSSDALADMRQLVSSVATLPFLSSSLAFALVYIWSRRNPSVKMSLFGIITITAPYLPMALVLFTWVFQGGVRAAVPDIVGALAGHTYVFLQDYWPREMWSTTGRPEIQTPGFVKRLFGQEER
ncbi:hypothetical protein D1P53_001595 [Cryptococcus gattii VGV]|nr:hypothetical protein D1P53_001595 [Cryptococcus gattii VGV]